jgi:hypothetical protein
MAAGRPIVGRFVFSSLEQIAMTTNRDLDFEPPYGFVLDRCVMAILGPDDKWGVREVIDGAPAGAPFVYPNVRQFSARWLSFHDSLAEARTAGSRDPDYYHTP